MSDRPPRRLQLAQDGVDPDLPDLGDDHDPRDVDEAGQEGGDGALAGRIRVGVADEQELVQLERDDAGSGEKREF